MSSRTRPVGWVRHKLLPETSGWQWGWMQLITMAIDRPRHGSAASGGERDEFINERTDLFMKVQVFGECQDGMNDRKEAAASRLAALETELVSLIESIGDESQTVAIRAPQLQKQIQKEQRMWNLLEQQSFPLHESMMGKGSVCSAVDTPHNDMFKVSSGDEVLLLRAEDEKERNAWLQTFTSLLLSNSLAASTGVLIDEGAVYRNQLEEPRHKGALAVGDLGRNKEVGKSERHIVASFLSSQEKDKSDRLGAILSKNKFIKSGNPAAELAKRAFSRRSGGGQKSFLALHWEHKELDSVPSNLWQHPQYHGLDVLYLDNNYIGVLPQEMSALKSLSILSLCQNRISVLPEWIGTFTDLQTFVLAFNSISELPMSLGELNKLKIFNVFSNALDKLPISLAKCVCIEQLNLGRNCWKENRGDPPSMQVALPRALIDGVKSGKLKANTDEVMQFLRERFEFFEAEVEEHRRQEEQAAKEATEKAARAKNIYSRKAYLALSASKRELVHVKEDQTPS